MTITSTITPSTTTSTIAGPSTIAVDGEAGTAAASIHPDFELAAVDLYRDIHKGIRAELFAITSTAGSVDPDDIQDRSALADHVRSVAAVLESHAHHEDAVIDPALDAHLPRLAERIRVDHERLDARFARVTELAHALVAATTPDRRRLAQLLHLDLAAFTSEYLAHIDLEERAVMPALERCIGVDAVVGMQAAIVGSIPPDEMARSLAFMLPAMNVLDRAELLDGIRAGAPAPAFDAVVGLARSVLRRDDFVEVAHRIGLR